MGVVNDLANQKESAIGKLRPGLVGILDCTVNAVTKPELPGQSEGQVSDAQPIAVRLQGLNDCAMIVGAQPSGDLVPEAKAFSKVGLLHGVNLHHYPEAQQRWPDDRAPHTSRAPAAA